MRGVDYRAASWSSLRPWGILRRPGPEALFWPLAAPPGEKNGAHNRSARAF